MSGMPPKPRYGLRCFSVLVFLLRQAARDCRGAGYSLSRIIAGFGRRRQWLSPSCPSCFPRRLDVMAGNLVITPAALAVYLPGAGFAFQKVGEGGRSVAPRFWSEPSWSEIPSPRLGILTVSWGLSATATDFYVKNLDRAVIQAPNGRRGGQFTGSKHLPEMRTTACRQATRRQPQLFSGGYLCFLNRVFCLCQDIPLYGSTTALDCSGKIVFNVKERAGYVDTGISGAVKVWRNQPSAFAFATMIY